MPRITVLILGTVSMARRSKFNAEARRRIIQAIQTGCTYELAAQYAGISRGTLWLWLQKGEQQKSGAYRTFLNEFKKAEARCCVGSLAVIQKAAQDGTWQAAAFLLERRFGYHKDGPPPVQITIDADAVDVRSIVEEYRREVLPVIGTPTIDLDEE